MPSKWRTKKTVYSGVVNSSQTRQLDREYTILELPCQQSSASRTSTSPRQTVSMSPFVLHSLHFGKNYSSVFRTMVTRFVKQPDGDMLCSLSRDSCVYSVMAKMARYSAQCEAIGTRHCLVEPKEAKQTLLTSKQPRSGMLSLVKWRYVACIQFEWGQMLFRWMFFDLSNSTEWGSIQQNCSSVVGFPIIGFD